MTRAQRSAWKCLAPAGALVGTWAAPCVVTRAEPAVVAHAESHVAATEPRVAVTEPRVAASASATTADTPCGAAVAGMACVAGGAFLRGSDDGPHDTRPRAEVSVDSFYMDVTEVTVAAYDACVEARRCKPAKTSYDDFSRPQQPKVGASWYRAKDYCAAQGKHLPTEAEWEKAARGTDGRLYPWGDKVATCEEAVIKDARGRSCGVKKKGAGADKGRTFEVGSRAPNQYGIFDMSGNAWEWVADWYSKSWASCGAACAGTNPKGPCDGKEPCSGHYRKLVRGGSWYWDASYATTVFRQPHAPNNQPYHHYGFRCAASVEEGRALGAK